MDAYNDMLPLRSVRGEGSGTWPLLGAHCWARGGDGVMWGSARGQHRKQSWWRHRDRRGDQQARRPPGYLAELVDGAGRAHLVTRQAYEKGVLERSGWFEALCGRVAVGSMAAPPRFSCHSCQVLKPQE